MSTDTQPFLLSEALQQQYRWVALAGQRQGYLQLASTQPGEWFHQTTPELFGIAHAWAIVLEETLHAQRVYWITLAEQTRQVHIHLYPRWQQDTLKGVPLFEDRFNPQQPAWSDEAQAALSTWAQTHGVYLLGV